MSPPPGRPKEGSLPLGGSGAGVSRSTAPRPRNGPAAESWPSAHSAKGAHIGALPPLVDLLGARWSFGAPVVAVAWQRGGGRAAFALGDGALVLSGAVQVRPGQPAALPREAERIPAHDGACLALAADGEGGFLSGGDDGRLLRLVPGAGLAELVCYPGQWIDHLAVGARGLRAYALGRRVLIQGPGHDDCLTLASGVTALAFDPAGQTLAIAGQGGVSLWSAADRGIRRLAALGYHRALAWSPDGRYLASGLQENALCCWRLGDGRCFSLGGYPGQPRALSFSGRGHQIATSGGPRVVGWDLDRPRPEDSREEFGYPSRVPVSAVAWHPGRALVAVGYHNGAVLLCRPGSDQHLFIKGSGAGPVTAVAWAPDGASLALGTQYGELAMVAVPAEILRMARAA